MAGLMNSAPGMTAFAPQQDPRWSAGSPQRQEATRYTAMQPMVNIGSRSSAMQAPPRAWLAGNSPYTALRPNIRQGLASSKYSSYINPLTTPDKGGVVAGQAPQQNAVQKAMAEGPSLAEIQAEMKRREVGAQLNQNPANSAVAGYMMG